MWTFPDQPLEAVAHVNDPSELLTYCAEGIMDRRGLCLLRAVLRLRVRCLAVVIELSL